MTPSLNIARLIVTEPALVDVKPVGRVEARLSDDNSCREALLKGKV
jgi:hypothetical protein